MSIRIPSSLLRETITVEPFEGSAAYGPVYGAPETVKARVEGKRRLVRRPSGSDIISTAAAFVRPDVTVTVESRVTHGERVYEVADVLRGEGLTGAAFLELVLA